MGAGVVPDIFNGGRGVEHTVALVLIPAVMIAGDQAHVYNSCLSKIIYISIIFSYLQENIQVV